MSTNLQRHDSAPPPLEEGYWKALLDEGEFAEAVHTQVEFDHHDEFAGHNDHQPREESLAETDSDWETITGIMDRDEVMTLPVIGYNRGGVLVEWHTLRGFVPASQLINFPATAPLTVRRNALADRIGQTLDLRVIELSAEQNRFILSERAAQVEAGERAQILVRLNPGDRVRGSITNLCDFGAFVDLGGLEGLIHISELSWGRVGHPGDMLQRGQEVEVYVLSVDRDNARIALSLKRLFPDPWKTVNERYSIGHA